MKPYPDGELYKTAIEIFALECCSPAVFDIAHKLPLSNDTATRRVSDISDNLINELSQYANFFVIFRICKDFQYYSFALDCSKDILDIEQLVVFVRGITGLMNKWRCDNNWTPVLWHYCIIHKENLISKNIKMENVSEVVIKIVNWIRANAFNHRKFKTFLTETDSDYDDVLLFSVKQIPELHFEEDSDILIAGAGVFGCAFGYAMAQLGHKVTIIEKDIHNNTAKLLGEYLQPGGILALEKLGMKGSFTSNLSSQIVSKELWKRRDMSSTTTTRTANMRPSVEDAVNNADMMVMPCRSTANSFPTVPGLIQGGDSFNTRHPLTGAGLTVALYDAILLRNRLEGVDLSNYRAVLRRLGTFSIERALNHSFVVNVMSFALYQVFAPVDGRFLCIFLEVGRNIRSACVAYLQRKGECLAGPTNLSVSSPFIFFYHFGSVALHSCYLIGKSHSVRCPHLIARDVFIHLIKACCIVGPLIWNDIRAILSI
ncbi:squalene monooxygenase-like [Octopus sinensis]|uniref:Squalene monooxygenase n=1 Tax=Octopus sinensis TaxID=2607531 RepID=A0A6P7TTT8_9MOLL|nr:squalene monooxygenase-like [Octopus sinensis]